MIYRVLAERYGFSPQVVAELSDAQILMLLDDGGKKQTRKFGSMADFRAWQREMGQAQG